jgi:hypothetical protein
MGVVGSGRNRANEADMDRLDEDLKTLRDMQQRFASLLARTRPKTEDPSRDELTHVTEQLLKSLDAEIAAIEKAQEIGG